MHGVGVDAFGEVGADRALFSFLRIGGTHQLTILGDGVFAFENLNHHGTGGHEVDEVVEEGTFLVHSVEAFSFGTGELAHLSGNDLESGVFKTGVDLADHVLGDCVGLDDGKSALNSHLYLLKVKSEERVRR